MTGSRIKAKKYFKDFLKISPLSHALWRSVEALAYDQIKLKKPVLDIGCGWGEFAGVVFDQVETGIDINEKELKMATRGKEYIKVKWVDARKMPFKNSSYGSVLSVSVLEHIEHNEKVVTEASRVLKKDGIFVFSVPTPELLDNLLFPKILKNFGLNNLSEHYKKLHCKVFKHFALRPKNWWIKTLEKNGFEIVKIEGTISPTVAKLHEIFLITAFPSQIWKLLTGKRLLITTGLRSKLLPLIFSRFIYLDKDSDINLFIIARKK